jgi:hypothetical protein
MRMPVICLLEVADATKWAGDDTVELFAGEVTVTAAKAETVRATKANKERMALFNVNRKTLSE